jgi:hypothetical protein
MDSIRSRRTWAIGGKYARSDARLPLLVVNLRCFKLSSWTRPELQLQPIVAWAGFHRAAPRPFLTIVVMVNAQQNQCVVIELDCRCRGGCARHPVVRDRRWVVIRSIPRRTMSDPPWKIFRSSEHGVALGPPAIVGRGSGLCFIAMDLFRPNRKMVLKMAGELFGCASRLGCTI